MIVPPFLIRLLVCKPLRGGRLGPEDKIAIDFASRLRAHSLQGRLRAAWTHVPNEVGGGNGRGSQIRYAIAKAMGMVTGCPDYLFLSGAGAWALEAKAGRNVLTDGQKDFREWCALHGVPFSVFRTPDEGEEKLREWGVLENV